MLLSLQYLRGVAALMIVYAHAVGPIERLTGTVLPGSISGYGVDLFFVISGMVMWLSTFGKDITPQTFMLNRLVRIAPLYWSITLAVTAVALIAPNVLRSTTFDLPHLLASLAFIPWSNPKYPGLWPVVIPGWTLNYEMFFYLIFSVMLTAKPLFRIPGTVAVLGVLALAGFTLRLEGVLWFYTNPIVLEFGFGVIVGAAYTSRLNLSRSAAAFMALAGLVLVLAPIWPDTPRLIHAGVPAALIVAGCAFYERERGIQDVGLLRHLGDASYSLYLSHPITLAATAVALARTPYHNALHWSAVLAALVLVSVAIGSAVYLLVERPLTRLARGAARGGSNSRAKVQNARHSLPASPSTPGY